MWKKAGATRGRFATPLRTLCDEQWIPQWPTQKIFVTSDLG